jgi:hypothetical protein
VKFHSLDLYPFDLSKTKIHFCFLTFNRRCYHKERNSAHFPFEFRSNSTRYVVRCSHIRPFRMQRTSGSHRNAEIV